jgi:hypothetical protein
MVITAPNIHRCDRQCTVLYIWFMWPTIDTPTGDVIKAELVTYLEVNKTKK